jgi:hypothetical protein
MEKPGIPAIAWLCPLITSENLILSFVQTNERIFIFNGSLVQQNFVNTGFLFSFSVYFLMS